MFESIARQLINFMGHSGAVPGALAPQDLPAALEHLAPALRTPEMHLAKGDRDEEDGGADLKSSVSMAHRALPLLDMLKSAIK